VMMVLHVEPRTRTGMLVSFPRDLLVPVPGHGTQQINATYNEGGPDLVVQTLQAAFPPLKINHYIEVNFQGFKDIVNAIGRIPLWFPTPAHDPDSGLNVDTSGCVRVDGDTALAYARSREYYVPQDPARLVKWEWNYDPNLGQNAFRGGRGWTHTGSDLDRIQRQQYFLRTISQYAISKTAENPTKLFALFDAVKSSFTHDTTLKYSELKALIRTFRGLDPKKIEMSTLPVLVVTSGPDRGRVIATDAAQGVAARLMDFGANTPLPAPKLLKPNQVTVRVVSGSGVIGDAQRVADAFRAAGYHVAGRPAEADRSNYQHTQVRYVESTYGAGITAGIAVGTLNIVEADSRVNTLGADVLVIVGRDYDTLRHNYTLATPSSTTTLPSGASTTSSSTSTTTIQVSSADPRMIPTDPKHRGLLVGCPS